MKKMMCAKISVFVGYLQKDDISFLISDAKNLGSKDCSL